MRIVVNGAEREVEPGATLGTLLGSLGLRPGAVAVEWNGRVLARPEVAGHLIRDGDRGEIVRFVGGG